MDAFTEPRNEVQAAGCNGLNEPYSGAGISVNSSPKMGSVMRNIMNYFVIFLVVLVLSPHVLSQSVDDSLPRRGFFGVSLDEDEEGEVYVSSVVQGSTAAVVGILSGDIILSIDGKPMQTMADVLSAIGSHRGGDQFTASIHRSGRLISIEGTLKEFPLLVMEDALVEYGSVLTSDGIRLRTIVTVPKDVDTKAPAILYLQGGGCGTAEVLFGTNPKGISGIVHALAAQGFITMRVEKSGVGDSQGPPCSSIGYYEELDGYKKALAALKRYPKVDTDRLYVIGASLGGVFAPIVGSEENLAGVVVYGTLAGPPPPYPGRSARFFEEFKNVNVLEAWTKINAPVLVLNGEYDAVTTESDHALIAATINKAKPGTAIHKQFEKLDHCMTRHNTIEESKNVCGGETTTELLQLVLEFFRK